MGWFKRMKTKAEKYRGEAPKIGKRILKKMSSKQLRDLEKAVQGELRRRGAK